MGGCSSGELNQDGFAARSRESNALASIALASIALQHQESEDGLGWARFFFRIRRDHRKFGQGRE